MEPEKGSRNDNLSLDNSYRHPLSLFLKLPLQSSLLREMEGREETVVRVLALWAEHLNDQGTLNPLPESVECPSGWVHRRYRL